MYSSGLFHFLFIIFNFTFFLLLPVSFSFNGDRFINCRRPFECGGIQNITYPFWGSPKPSYCGLPEFEVKCQNEVPVLEIMSQRYRVLMINHDTQLLQIAKIDFLNTNCPSQFSNTTLNYLFEVPHLENITLFYGCSPWNTTWASSRFNCGVNDTASDNESGYFVMGSVSVGENPGKCNDSVVVPVLPSAIQALSNNLSTINEVLNEGFEVKYIVDDTACAQCLDSGGQCGYNRSQLQPICFCPDGLHLMACPALSEPKRKASKKIVTASSIIGACTITAAAVLFCYMRRKPSMLIMFQQKKRKNAQIVEDFLKNCGSFSPKRYSYSDVKKMTDCFKDKLGQGGYGAVYKGKLPNGRLVAVKVLNNSKGNGEEFLNEVASISRTSHVNVVTLLGFCFEDPKRALIYELMFNGSLEKFIYDEKLPNTHSHLGSDKIFQIAVGIARGLEYLHCGCNTPILHLDIKPHNILLDQDFCPKISDFGLAKLWSKKENIISMMGTRGTVGYIAPEVFSRNFGVVSHKSDVYSYGMMLLEMAGRRRNADIGLVNTSETYFPHWIYRHLKLDEDLGVHTVIEEAMEEVTLKMVLVGLWCIQTDPMNRPSMSRVVEMLEGGLDALELPPKPYLSSPPISPEGSCTITLSVQSDSF